MQWCAARAFEDFLRKMVRIMMDPLARADLAVRIATLFVRAEERWSVRLNEQPVGTPGRRRKLKQSKKDLQRAKSQLQSYLEERDGLRVA
jgi:hypothetical protein